MRENNNPEVSVIVPIYNVAPYLKRCLDSLKAQTMQKIEFILVDDGSTDESGRIAEEYCKEDRRFKVFHKENGGVSSARNLGMKQAGGGYIGF